MDHVSQLLSLTPTMHKRLAFSSYKSQRKGRAKRGRRENKQTNRRIAEEHRTERIGESIRLRTKHTQTRRNKHKGENKTTNRENEKNRKTREKTRESKNKKHGTDGERPQNQKSHKARQKQRREHRPNQHHLRSSSSNNV